jgi:carbonic anhydrase
VTRRDLISSFALQGSLILAQGAAGTKELQPARRTAGEILQELTRGNARFASDHARHPHSKTVWVRKTWREGQHPSAAVLCCSDSRVPPEILFDQGIGDLFCVRVAGNSANEDEIASLAYAVEHLHVPLCVILGHSECGAVTAVVEGEKLPLEIQHLVAHIGDALRSVKLQNPGLSGKALVSAAVRANVLQAMHDLVVHGPMIRERLRSGRLEVVGGIYHIDTGKVAWLGPHPQQRELLAAAR